MIQESDTLTHSGYLDLGPTWSSPSPASCKAGMDGILLTLVSAPGKMGTERKVDLGVSERAAKPFERRFEDNGEWINEGFY